MEIPEQLRCLISAEVEERDGSYIVEIPEQEVQIGDIGPDKVYRVALISATADGENETSDTEAEPDQNRGQPRPPVQEGEQRNVEIEDLGEQGDGLTRVERGFVIIVPDTEMGERVTIEITDVRQNVAFAEVVERRSYYA